jgi:hypothetical protein
VGQLPAAAELNQQTAEALVHQALEQESGRAHKNHNGILSFYAATSDPANDGNEAVLCALLQQPAVQRLAPDAVARLLAMCMEQVRLHPWMLLLCSELTAAKQGDLGQDAVRQLLQLAYEAQQWAVFDWLVGLAAAPLGDEQVAMWCAVRALITCQLSQSWGRIASPAGCQHLWGCFDLGDAWVLD